MLVRRRDLRSTVPGEWSWWVDHADPRLPEPVRLIGDDALVWRSVDGHVAAFTSSAQDLARLLGTEPVAPVTGLMISQHDAVTLYLACGFQRVDRLRTWARRDRQD